MNGNHFNSSIINKTIITTTQNIDIYIYKYKILKLYVTKNVTNFNFFEESKQQTFRSNY